MDCVKKFNGMWVFCIYDSDEKILFCSRDRFGVKPFYYFKAKDTFVFASEIKAILSLPLVERIVNEPILHDYLIFGLLEHTNETFFKNIFKLQPSHNLIYDLSTNKLVHRYYKLKIQF